MTVNPGWGGQAFLPWTVPARSSACGRSSAPGPRSRSTAGSTLGTAATCAAAGATVFVAGSAVFRAPDPGAAYREIAAAVAGVRPAV